MVRGEKSGELENLEKFNGNSIKDGALLNPLAVNFNMKIFENLIFVMVFTNIYYK